MTTADAATTSGHVGYNGCPFCHTLLDFRCGSVVVLRRMFRKNPVEREIEDRDMQKGGDDA